jgi:hypothetical protein
MTTIAGLLMSMRERGVMLWLANGELRLRAPKGAMCADEISALRARKSEIVEFLEKTRSVDKIPLLPRASSDPVPLTNPQQWIWGGDATQPAGHVRSIAFAIGIAGPLQVDVLRDCLMELVERHETLRTRLVMRDGQPTQWIDPPGKCCFDVVDEAALAAVDPVHGLAQLVDEIALQRVHVCVGPLFAARLIRQSHDAHVLVLCLDHTVADGLSKEILNRELWTLYRHRVRGRAFSLPTLPIQFADYAVWLRKIHAGWLQKHGPYWKARLCDAPPLRLPSDHNADESIPGPGNVLEMCMGEHLTRQLLDFSREERVFPALVMLAVYTATISRWAHEKDVLLIFVDSGRWCSELESTVGWLVDHLHLRIEASEATTFLDLLGVVIQEFHAACEHRDFHWAPALAPGCKRSLYFNWLALEGRDGFLTGRSDTVGDLQIRRIDRGWAGVPALEMPLDLAIFFSPTATDIKVAWVYRSDRFMAATIERLARNLRAFTATFLERPATSMESMHFSI